MKIAKNILILTTLLTLANLSIIDIDYQPITEAFTKAKAITDKYETFKSKVAKNTTLEYEKCMKQIKESKCNNLDQWQSVIEELKLQIQNSQEIEIPFLEFRKNLKVERLKELITLGEQQSEGFSAVGTKIAEYQAFLIDNVQFIELMYKLPKKNEEEVTEFAQQIDVTHELNANIPDIAGDNSKITTQNYEIGDISIQAQTTRNIMGSTLKHTEQTIATMMEAKNITDTDQLAEKEKLKASIENLRALIANQQWIQAESQTKINELEGKIAACKGMPTNIQKDCEPLILKQKKKNAEIEIMKTRTMQLLKDLQKVMEENEPDTDIQAHADSIKAKKEAEFRAVIEQSYMKEEIPGKSTKLAEELKPIHHMKQVIEQQMPAY